MDTASCEKTKAGKKKRAAQRCKGEHISKKSDKKGIRRRTDREGSNVGTFSALSQIIFIKKAQTRIENTDLRLSIQMPVRAFKQLNGYDSVHRFWRQGTAGVQKELFSMCILDHFSKNKGCFLSCKQERLLHFEGVRMCGVAY